MTELQPSRTYAMDLSIIPHAVGGVARYLLDLARALNRVAAGNSDRFITVDVPDAHPGVSHPEPVNVVVPSPVYTKIPFARRIPRKFHWEEKSRGRRIALAAGEISVYHHSGVQPVFPPGASSVVTIFDLIPLEHPEWLTDHTLEYFRREMDLIASGSYACVISRWTAERLMELSGIPEERIFVAGGAASEDFVPGKPSVGVMERYGLEPGRYLLHVGNMVPRKMIPFLVEAYRKSGRRGLGIDLVLVAAGGWGGIRVKEGEGVRVLKRVPDEDMPHIYRGARVLLLPSRCEGLGLPVMEALACGIPVVAADAAAIPETLGSHGLLLPAGDMNAWVEAISMMSDETWMRELSGRLRGYVRPTWEDVAGGVLEFYGKTAGR